MATCLGWALAAGAAALAAADSSAPRRELQTTDEQCEAANIDLVTRTKSYFDVASLTCMECPGLRIRSEDGKHCVCDRNSAADPCAPAEEDCPCVQSDTATNKYASQDGTVLMSCQVATDEVYQPARNPPSTASGALLDCQCDGDNQRLVEFDSQGRRLRGAGGLEKRCMPCPRFTYINPDNRYECLPCPGDGEQAACRSTCSQSRGDGGCPDTCPDEAASCTCISIAPTGDIFLGDCVEESWLDGSVPADVRSSYPNMEYKGVSNGESDDSEVTLVSQTFKEVFWPKAASCFRVVKAFTEGVGPAQLERTQACQALANLCVLQDYDERSGAVCKLFEDGGKLSLMIRTEADGDYVNGETSWLKHLPWLYRDTGIRTDTESIKLKVGFDLDPDDPGVVRALPFKLSAWSLDGTWLGFEDLTTQLDVCSDLPFGTAGNQPDYLNVGYGIYKECTLNITTILEEKTAPVQKFYDLYLVDADGTLVPTATKLLNFRVNNNIVNIDSNQKEDQLDERFTSRFMLFDRVSGLESANDEYPRVFRYPKSVKLTVTVTELGAPPSVFAPIVTIEYGSIDVNALQSGDWDEGAIVKMSFSVEYVKDLESYENTLRVVFAICCTLCACEWGISVVLHSRNRPSGAVDGPFLMRSLFEGVGCASRWIFLLMFCGCFYWWFFFKMQAEVKVLLPTAADIEPFRVMLTTGFVAKLLSLAHVLWRQCQVDVFFVDWEKSHGRLVDAAGDGGESGGGDVMAPVSYWRSLFITNEWAELQTKRMVNVELTLLGLVFLLRGCNLDNLATSNPDVEDLRGEEEGGSSVDPVLHFFVGSALILLLSGTQIAFKKVFYHRYVHDPLEAFIDLLYAANLSSVILSDVHCGYYLGGDGAPHSHMDTDMQKLRENLTAETTGKTKPRGLATEGIHAFVVFITPRIRQLYDGQFTRLVNGVHNPGMADSLQKDAARKAHPAEEAAVKAYDSLNKLFRKFIKTTDPNSDYAHQVRARDPPPHSLYPRSSATRTPAEPGLPCARLALPRQHCQNFPSQDEAKGKHHHEHAVSNAHSDGPHFLRPVRAAQRRRS